MVSDRIDRAFNISGGSRALAHNMSKTFDWVWHAGFLHKVRSYEISGQIYGHI